MKNKILTKIGALVVGLTMAVGVGIAVSNNARLEARATEPSGIVFKSNSSDSSSAASADTFLTTNNMVESNSLIASCSTAANIYAGKNGAKFGTSSKSGNLVLVLNGDCKENISTITFVTAKYGSDTGTFSFKADTTTLKTGQTPGEDYTHQFAEATTVTSIEISTSAKRGYLKSITVTYVGGDPEPVEDVLLDQTELSLEVGKTAKLTATVLPANAHDKSVTWSSDNEDVATVDNGTVTAVAKGEATITVTTVYGGCSATCDVTVTEPAPKLTFNLVKDASDLAVGDKVIIAAAGSNVAMSTIQNNNNRGQVSITKDEESILEVDNLQIFTLEEGKIDDTFAFNVGGGYIYAASSGSNYLKTETTLSNNSSFSVAIAADGTATLVAQGSNTRNVIQYNEGSSIFSCYGSASQKAVSIYKAAASDATVLEAAGYAKSFLGAMTCETVDGQSSVTAAEGAWANMKSAYEALSADAQKYLKNHDAADKDAAVPTGDVTKDNAEAYIGAALIRYEWIIHVYTEATYENFMGRTINATSSTNVEPVKFDHATKNNITLVIIILSVAAITALGAYLFIDKRRKTSK